MIGGWSAHRDADGDRAERAHQELALGADVEQAGLEAEGDRQAAEDERRGRDEGVDDRVEAAERALDQRGVGRRSAAASRTCWPGTSSSDSQMTKAPTTSASRIEIERQASESTRADATACQARGRPVAAGSRVGRGASCRLGAVRRLPRRSASRRRSPSAGRPRSCRPSGRRRRADDPAAVHHRDPVRHLEHLVELGRHEQDRRPRVALRDRLAVDELDAADVEAARRLVEDEQLQRRGRTRGRRRPSAGCRPTACRRGPSADGVRMSYSRDRRRSAASLDRAVVAQDRRGRTARGSSSSGRGCRRAGTAGRARTGGGRPGT